MESAGLARLARVSGFGQGSGEMYKWFDFSVFRSGKVGFVKDGRAGF